MRRLNKFLVCILLLSVLLCNTLYGHCFEGEFEGMENPTYYGISFLVIIGDANKDSATYIFPDSRCTFGINNLFYIDNYYIGGLFDKNIGLCEDGFYFKLVVSKQLDIGDGLHLSTTLHISPIFIILCCILILFCFNRLRGKRNEKEED